MSLQHRVVPNTPLKRSRKPKDTPGIGHNADTQVKSIIDRILRLHEEAKAINDDIRDVYAEAKGNGFDKSALGVAVRVIRKREKDGDKFEEQNALVDLYLSAYSGTGTRVATHMHAREALPPHDPTTGEITEVSPQSTGAVSAPAEPAADKGSASNSEIGNGSVAVTEDVPAVVAEAHAGAGSDEAPRAHSTPKNAGPAPAFLLRKGISA